MRFIREGLFPWRKLFRRWLLPFRFLSLFDAGCFRWLERSCCRRRRRCFILRSFALRKFGVLSQWCCLEMGNGRLLGRRNPRCLFLIACCDYCGIEEHSALSIQVSKQFLSTR